MILAVGCAWALDTLDAQRFHPAVWGPLFTVPTAITQIAADGPSLRLVGGAATDPVVWRAADGTEQGMVDLLAGGELDARWALDRIAAQVAVPAWRVQGPDTGTAVVLGDLRVDGIVAVLPPSAFGLGVTGEVRLPTGDESRWLGAPGVTGGGGIVATASIAASGSTISATVGADSGSRYDVPAFRWGPAFTWSAGVGQSLVGRLWAVAEIDGAVPLREGGGVPPGEWRGGLGFAATEALTFHAGAGRGYTRGLGNPDLRVFAGLTVSRPPMGAHPDDRP